MSEIYTRRGRVFRAIVGAARIFEFSPLAGIKSHLYIKNKDESIMFKSSLAASSLARSPIVSSWYMVPGEF